MKHILGFFLVFIFACNYAGAQKYDIEKDSLVYKEVDGHSLEMFIYKPRMTEKVELPAIVFYFGGGWVGGNPNQFKLQAEYFASRGIIVVCPEYRTKSKHGTSPFESVKDAKSAMRYLKINGAEMGIDTSKIVAAGGSAGGHLAACTALIDDINEKSDLLSVSPKPFALVLFNPVVDTSKRGYGQKKVAGREFEISPVHHVTEGVAPTLIMHGKADKTVPYENVIRFKQIMKQAGNECTLKGYKKQSHGFFNFSKKAKYFKKTLQETEEFLEEYNLLKGKTWVNKYYRSLKKV